LRYRIALLAGALLLIVPPAAAAWVNLMDVAARRKRNRSVSLHVRVRKEHLLRCGVYFSLQRPISGSLSAHQALSDKANAAMTM
jgi:hypothetical protein